jgi:predicted ATP-grasp superfamily ATP-dependent carboligase
MRNELYVVDEEAANELREAGHAPVMLFAFDGFIDAGIVAGLAINDLVNREGSKRLVTFNADELVDYRKRRPHMIFDEQGWSAALTPDIAIDLVHDAAGTPLLVMHGPEPDLRWEAFADGVIEIVEQFDVSLAVGMHGLPMPVPHTRDLPVTTAENRREILGQIGGVAARGLDATAESPMPAIQLPGGAQAFLEYRLNEIGRDATSVIVHVPSYLALVPYPRGAVDLLVAIGASAGLEFDISRLEKGAEKAQVAISKQVEANEELTAAVAKFERAYDDRRALAAALPSDVDEATSAEKLVAQLEEFLASQDAGTADENE